MLDRTIPFYNAILRCDHYQDREVVLPCGFSIVPYEKGFEKAWAELEYAIGDFDSLDEAEDYAMEVYNDLKNGKSDEYLNDSIYRPNEGMCITSVSIHEYDTEDNNYNEFIKDYGFEPYVQ